MTNLIYYKHWTNKWKYFKVLICHWLLLLKHLVSVGCWLWKIQFFGISDWFSVVIFFNEVMNYFGFSCIESFCKSPPLILLLLKSPFFFLLFSNCTLMIFLIIIAVLMLNLLVLILAALILTRFLFCSSSSNWLLRHPGVW